MAEDWLADVKKHVADVDEAAVAGIVRYCGIALRNPDSSLVSFSDKTETDRVRENFLKKKLALTDPDDVLDSAIATVSEKMKDDRTKNRVTVYYLLGEHFDKLHLFGGQGAAKAAGVAAGAAGLAAGGSVASVTAPANDFNGSSDDTDRTVEALGGAGAAVTAAGAAGLAGLGSTAGAATDMLGATGSRAAGAGAGAATAGAAGLAALGGNGDTGGSGGGSGGYGGSDGDGRTGSGFGKWWPWLLLLLALIILFLLLRSCQREEVPVVTTNTSEESLLNATGGAPDNGAAAVGNATSEAAGDLTGNAMAPAPTTAEAIPAGAGVVAGERDGLPMVTTYFDTGKADVSSQFGTASSTLKTYVDQHPGAKLAVSGFNDPSGNAAVNAAISKKRALAVAAALKASGIPAAAIVMQKPADTTITNANPALARRVEVTVIR